MFHSAGGGFRSNDRRNFLIPILIRDLKKEKVTATAINASFTTGINMVIHD